MNEKVKKSNQMAGCAGVVYGIIVVAIIAYAVYILCTA